eukprot:tig00001376_g8543.t1
MAHGVPSCSADERSPLLTPLLKHERIQHIEFRAVCTVALAAMFFLFEYILQIAPGVMTNELMADLHIDGAGLGSVLGFFFFSYAACQIPAGLAHDIFGPRKVLPVMCTICTIGGVVFAIADTPFHIGLGRLLIGVGGAHSYTGTMVLASRWLPQKHFASVAGIVSCFCSLGAIIAGAPFGLAVAAYGWRASMMAVSCAGFLLALALALLIRDFPPGREPGVARLEGQQAEAARARNTREELSRLLEVTREPQNWALALHTFTSWGPVAGAAALWMVPFLAVQHRVATPVAAGYVGIVWVGVALGSPCLGALSDRLGKRRPFLIASSALGLLSTSVLVYVVALPLSVACPFLFLFGVAATSPSIAASIIEEKNDPEHIGTALAFNNLFCVMGGGVLQPLIGLLLKLRWSHLSDIHRPIPTYGVREYRFALVVLPICYAFGLLLATMVIRSRKHT